MIKHILKQIWVERRQNSWILLELMVVFFFFLLMNDFLWVKLKNYLEPKGFDIEDTFLLQLKLLEAISPQYTSPEESSTTVLDDLIRLTGQIEQYPDIELLSLSLYSPPYSMGGFWSYVKRDTFSTNSIRIRQVTPDYFELFRIRSADGSPIRIEAAGHRQAILSEDVAWELFGSANEAIGQEVYLSDMEEANKVKVVAVSTRYKMQDFYPYQGTYYEILSLSDLKDLEKDNRIAMVDLCVRVRPGTARHFSESFETEMGERLRVNNLYVSSIVPSEKLKDNEVGKMLRQDVLPMVYVMIFVLITVYLGVFGAFWLRIRQRYSEIGIRMAMGANRNVVRRSMMYEGLILISLVILPALLVYLNMLNADILDTWRLTVTAGRVCIVTLFSLLLIIVMVTSAIYWPANHAASIQPVEALRDE